MALKKSSIFAGIVDFIHPDDGAINTDIDPSTDKPFSDLAKYRETWDFEQYCHLREDVKPTVFKLNFALSFKKQRAIKNATLGGNAKEDDFGFKLGNHQFQVVRSILTNIVQPDDLAPEDRFKFERGPDQLVSEDTMTDLENHGIVDDIYSFWMAKKSNSDLKKK